MKLNAFKIDAEKAEEGAWVSGIPDSGDLRLKVRSFRSAAFRKVRDRLLQAVPRDKRVNGQVDPLVADEITGRAMADAILLDWDGLTGEDGQPQPYDRLLAVKLLSEPDYRPFRDAVAWAASMVEERDATALADDLGNSSTASAGS